jgi:DNA-binding ferritin-like protein
MNIQKNDEEIFLAIRGTEAKGMGIKRTREDILDDRMTENIYDAIAEVFDKMKWTLTKAVKR